MPKKGKTKWQQMIESHIDQTKINPVCKHFGVCGGCRLQDHNQADQAEAKKAAWKELLHSTIEPEILSQLEIIYDTPYEYRTRMDYVYFEGKIGLRAKGSYTKVLDLKQCSLLPKPAETLFLKLKEIIKEKFEDYNYMQHTGFFRYVVIKPLDQLMVIFVTKSKDNVEAVEQVAKEALQLGAASVYWLVDETMADTSRGEIHRFWGEEYVTQTFLDKKFLIGPNTYQQSNIAIANKAYEEIVSHADGNVIDLFAGIGTISILLSDKVTSIIGVELDHENCQLAQKNIELNKSTNVTFVEKNARAFLMESDPCKTIIVDPPRAGLQKVAKDLNKKIFDKIIYMSCNPITLKEDLERMDNYMVTHAKLFDMFPQTLHLESIVILERK